MSAPIVMPDGRAWHVTSYLTARGGYVPTPELRMTGVMPWYYHVPYTPANTTGLPAHVTSMLPKVWTVRHDPHTG